MNEEFKVLNEILKEIVIEIKRLNTNIYDLREAVAERLEDLRYK